MAIKLPTLEVCLPSGGYGYKEEDTIPSVITLIMLSVFDTKTMLTGGKDIFGTIHKVLENCIVEKFNIKKLYTSDLMYLFFMLRAHSLGSEYALEYRCKNCEEKVAVKKIIPDDFEIREKSDDSSFEFETELPVTKYNVKLQLLTGEDEDVLYKRSLRDSNDRVIDRLAMHIVELIDPETKEVVKDFPTKKRLISGLPVRDMNKLDKVISDNEFGFKTVSIDECPHCGEQNEVMLSINQNFFRSE